MASPASLLRGGWLALGGAMKEWSSTSPADTEVPLEELDEQSVFFSLDPAELKSLNIKPGQMVSYDLHKGDNGRYYAINIEVVDAVDD
jgi:hypothetical protein